MVQPFPIIPQQPATSLACCLIRNCRLDYQMLQLSTVVQLEVSVPIIHRCNLCFTYLVSNSKIRNKRQVQWFNLQPVSTILHLPACNHIIDLPTDTNSTLQPVFETYDATNKSTPYFATGSSSTIDNYMNLATGSSRRRRPYDYSRPVDTNGTMTATSYDHHM